jgi:hypothetical protein
LDTRKNSWIIIIIRNKLKVIVMKESNGSEQQNQKIDTQWPDLLGQLFDRLTGKEAVITYSFRSLEVEIPRTAGLGGQSLGSAKWVINGDLVIKAQSPTHEIER